MIIYKPFAKIKAMSFDLDDTLYNNWPYIVEAERSLLNYIAERYPDTKHPQKEHWQQYKRQALRDDPALWSDMGDLRRTTLANGLRDSGYHGKALNEAIEDCFDYFYFQRSNFTVAPDIVALLQRLFTKIPLVAITNGNVNLQQIGIEHCFEHVLKASRQRQMKPHNQMFHEAQQLLSMSPQHILHVGDNLEKDVWGAARVNQPSAWYACDRVMDLRGETVYTLPNIQLQHLQELEQVL